MKCIKLKIMRGLFDLFYLCSPHQRNKLQLPENQPCSNRCGAGGQVSLKLSVSGQSRMRRLWRHPAPLLFQWASSSFPKAAEGQASTEPKKAAET